MKNIQVIDGADNCTFSLFQVTDQEFKLIFPEPGQDIEFGEDLLARISPDSDILTAIWSRPVGKPDAMGLHGTLFYGFAAKRQRFPATKREMDWDARALNPAQRRMYERKRRTGSEMP